MVKPTNGFVSHFRFLFWFGLVCFGGFFFWGVGGRFVFVFGVFFVFFLFFCFCFCFRFSNVILLNFHVDLVPLIQISYENTYIYFCRCFHIFVETNASKRQIKVLSTEKRAVAFAVILLSTEKKTAEFLGFRMRMVYLTRLFFFVVFFFFLGGGVKMYNSGLEPSICFIIKRN